MILEIYIQVLHPTRLSVVPFLIALKYSKKHSAWVYLLIYNCEQRLMLEQVSKALNALIVYIKFRSRVYVYV